MSQPKNTALHSSHIDLGAKMVNFAQWEMPITYSSLMEEHHAVRKNAGIFDVSHMAVFDFNGGDQIGFFEKKFSEYNRAETLSNKLDEIEFLAKKFYDNKK